MRAAIMQPYFLPYLGYFQLIAGVDVFVCLDNVNYRNRSWITRNDILENGSRRRITLQLCKASQNRKISDIRVGANAAGLVERIRHAYRRAPQFDAVMPVVRDLLLQREASLSVYLETQLRSLCSVLDIRTGWFTASGLDVPTDATGQDRIIEICRRVGADVYLNPASGRELYDARRFRDRGIELEFLEPGFEPYRQFGAEFVPGLSVVDFLMFVPGAEYGRYLEAGRVG